MANHNPGVKNATPGAFDSMTQLFPLSKTLRFRLVPMYETEKHIREDGYLGNDKELAEDIVLMKAASDRIHKDFIETVLSKHRIKYLSENALDSIQEYYEALEIEDPEERDLTLEEISTSLKAAIGQAFRKEMYDEKRTVLSALASEALLKELVPSNPLDDNEKAALARTQKYTTFMRSYFTARDRLYDPEQKGHTIPNRTIDDNLPIHLANVRVFASLPRPIVEGAAPVFAEVASSLDARDVSEVFCVSAFSCLAAQSAIDAYNTLVGGISVDEKTRIKGINELINEYKQQNPGQKVNKLKKLKKQILTDRDTLSWIPKSYEDDEKVKEVLRNLQDTFLKTVAPYGSDAVGASLKAVGFPDQTGVWIEAGKLDKYSNTAFGDWSIAQRCLKAAIRKTTPKGPRMSDKGYEEKLTAIFKKIKHFSGQEIVDAVREHGGLEAENALGRYAYEKLHKPIAEALKKYKDLDEYLTSMSGSEKLGQDGGPGEDNARSRIKSWLDVLIVACDAASVFSVPAGESMDTDFETYVCGPWQEFRETLIPVYNSVRNYLTKKPYSMDKTRLMFGNPILLGGWDTDKEPDNRGLMFRKGKDIYLGILPSHAKKLFTDGKGTEEGSALEKMEVKYLPNPFMMLPKVGIPKSDPKRYGASDEVIALNTGPKAVKDYSPEEVALMVDFYKGVIAANPAWKAFGFKFKETAEYRRLSEFFDDVTRQNYAVCFRGIGEDYVREAVAKGELFLFKLTCQDMSEAHHGKDENQTVLIRQALTEGLAGSRVRLSGNAAIYFREASLEKKVTHPAGVTMQNKNPDNPNRTRTLAYDLYKDKRFMEDQFMLHIPVAIAPNADRYGETRINRRVQDIIRSNPGMYVLGINRGERSLVNIAVTAPDGRIVEQRNLNVFDGFDYRRKLTEREKERNDDRQNWNAIREIKNLKAGYLSRVVGEIVRLQKKYGCVIAIERLDAEFKHGRQMFERNVYEQFERSLVGRFGLLMDSNDTDRTATALQLSSPGKTVEERNRYGQNGVIFFVSPSWITKTDPLTGFANRINTHFSSVRDCEKLVTSFDSITFDEGKNRFVFTFTQQRVTPNRENGDPFRVWKVETNGERLAPVWETEDGTVEKDKFVRLTAEMRRLLDKEGVKYLDGGNIVPALIGRKETFWKKFLDILRLTLTNNCWYPDTREFRIVSCTAGPDGKFYDSRTAPETMPKDADILAAWNIARKAHLILRNILEYDVENPPIGKNKKPIPPRTSVSDGEWFEFAQDQKA